MRNYLAKILHRQMLEQLPAHMSRAPSSANAIMLWPAAWVLAGHVVHVSILWVLLSIWMGVTHGAQS